MPGRSKSRGGSRKGTFVLEGEAPGSSWVCVPRTQSEAGEGAPGSALEGVCAGMPHVGWIGCGRALQLKKEQGMAN
jgi:hypothetical protein